MKARKGDRVLVSNTTKNQPREGVIVDLRNADGTPPYVVEWIDNGHRTVVLEGHGLTITFVDQ